MSPNPTARVLSTVAAVAGMHIGARRRRRLPKPLLRVTRHEIPWAEPALIRVVHLTDLHFGWATPRRLLETALETAWGLAPGLVVLTGDYVNHSLRHVDALSRFIGALPKPVVATLGNHDHWSGSHGVGEALMKGGAIVLQNNHTVVHGDGWELPVIGVDDGFTRRHRVGAAFSGVEHPARALVLTHFPNTADEIAHHGGRLVLSGHTHGGQFRVPGLTGAVMRLTGHRYLSGWYDVGQARLYVNAGLGNSHRGMRAGTPALPELACFDLQRPRAQA